MQLDGEKSRFLRKTCKCWERKWPHFYDFSIKKDEDYRFNKKEKSLPGN